MSILPQHVARANGQTHVSVDDRRLILERASTLELPQDAALDVCGCGDVECFQRASGHYKESVFVQAEAASAFSDAASEPVLVLPVGSVSGREDRFVILQMNLDRDGDVTARKLGIHDYHTLSVEHDVYGVTCRDSLFKLRDSEAVKRISGEYGGVSIEELVSSVSLGPGLQVLTEGVFFLPAKRGTRSLVRWVKDKRPNKAPLASFPKEILQLEPIPSDEKPYDRGGLERITVQPTAAGQPAGLYGNLLWERLIHSFVAPPGVGKSMATLAIVVYLISQGRTVLYVDADGNAGDRVNERTLSLGADPAALEERLYYYESDKITAELFGGLLRVVEPDLVVFDNLTNLFYLSGINENDNVSVVGWFNDFPAKVRKLGKAALILDHPGKTATGGYARGGSGKLAEQDLVWSVTKQEDFDRTKVGKVRFKLEKNADGVEAPKQAMYRIGGAAPCIFRLEEAARLTENEQKALAALENGMSSAEWRKALEDAPEEEQITHRESFRRAKNGLSEKGQVEEHEDKFFASE